MNRNERQLPHVNRQKERPYDFRELVRSAYDLGSNGMGVQLHLVSRAFQKSPAEQLPEWAVPAYLSHGSNYLASLYIIGLRRPDILFQTLQHVAPHSEDHKGVIDGMYLAYKELGWSLARDALEGLTGIVSPNKTRSITDPELRVYLEAADKRGLLERFRDSAEVTSDEIMLQLEPMPDVEYTEFDLLRRLFRAGVSFSEDFDTLSRSLGLSPAYRETTLRAATYKLGAMIAVTDQILFDAQASGLPISSSYVPEDRSGKLYTNWQSMFGEDIPTIARLYTHALEVFTRYADRSDPVLAYLFHLDPSQYLQR